MINIKISPQPSKKAIRYEWVILWESESMAAEFYDKDNALLSSHEPSSIEDVYCEKIGGVWYFVTDE